MKKLVLRLFAGAIQLGVIGYCALVAWLFDVWMVDDHWAATAQNVDWYRAAGGRLALGLVGASVIGVTLRVVNRGLARWDLVVGGARPAHIALLGAGAIGLASLAGTIQFLVTKPYM